MYSDYRGNAEEGEARIFSIEFGSMKIFLGAREEDGEEEEEEEVSKTNPLLLLFPYRG